MNELFALITVRQIDRQQNTDESRRCLRNAFPPLFCFVRYAEFLQKKKWDIKHRINVGLFEYPILRLMRWRSFPRWRSFFCGRFPPWFVLCDYFSRDHCPNKFSFTHSNPALSFLSWRNRSSRSTIRNCSIESMY